jgi:hypothetical protein
MTCDSCRTTKPTIVVMFLVLQVLDKASLSTPMPEIRQPPRLAWITIVSMTVLSRRYIIYAVIVDPVVVTVGGGGSSSKVVSMTTCVAR